MYNVVFLKSNVTLNYGNNPFKESKPDNPSAAQLEEINSEDHSLSETLRER